MALSLIKLHPNMTYDMLVSALNENFALIENLSRTNIYKDETGKRRIIIGQFPDNTWGIVMVKPGEDVLDVLD